MGSHELPGAARSFDQLVASVFGSRPTKAMIEIADRCNESCVHCYQVQGQKGEMSSDDIFRVLDELASAGVFFLTLSGGEATLRSDFLEIVRYARSLDFAITLFTNGLRIDDAMADELAAIGIRRAEISLYGLDPEVHDWVTNVPGSWAKTVAAVRRLTSRGVPVKLKTPQMAGTSGIWTAYREFAASLGAEAVMDPNLKAREDGARFPEQLRSDDEAFKALYPQLDVAPRPSDFDRGARKICGAAENVHVEPNGELRPCALLDLPLGDAREGLEGHRTSDVAQTLRGLRWADLPSCAGCAIAHHCSRCHAQALREVGDALMPYPDACRSALLRWEVASGGETELARRGVTGPFAMKDGVPHETEPPPLTESQRRLYEGHAWLRRSAQPSPPRAEPGQLVQLRRPGRRPKPERIPVSRAPSSANE